MSGCFLCSECSRSLGSFFSNRCGRSNGCSLGCFLSSRCGRSNGCLGCFLGNRFSGSNRCLGFCSFSGSNSGSSAYSSCTGSDTCCRDIFLLFYNGSLHFCLCRSLIFGLA